MHVPSLAEIIVHVQGGFRIFFLRRDALTVFGNQPSDFWKSFWCAGLLLPLYIWLFSSLHVPEGVTPPAPLQRWGGEIIGYVVSWVYWPLVMGYAVVALDKEDRYIPYVVAYNWAQSAPMLLYSVLALVNDVLPLGPWIGSIAFALRIWNIVFLIFLARTALGASNGMVVVLVVSDYILHYLILEVTDIVIWS